MQQSLTIGIIGSSRERHCLYLSQELERQGARSLILDNSPDQPYPLSYYEERDFYQDYDLSSITTYFLRALFLPSPAFDTSAIQAHIREEGYIAYAAERERYASWLAWLKTAPLHGRMIVNPVDTLIIHFAKPYQMESLRMAGIPIPATLITSDAKLLLDFCKHREVVYKPVAGGALCRLLTEDDKQPERLTALASAPVQFQEYIAGDDLRVFVLDGRVIASFLVAGEGIDYREQTSRLEYYPVSDEIAQMCVRACDTLGLIFSGVDLKLRPDGSVVMIECNPSPMFEGFDRVAPVPIVQQLASYLIEITRKNQARVVHAGVK